ncbi:hypothetical protein ACHWQZ_G019235 [Mnemiopsis leidyi]
MMPIVSKCFLILFLTGLASRSIEAGCEYTSYQQNVGMFSDANKMNQRQLRSDEACKEWCDQYPGCRAAVISPSYWAYRECFLVSTSTITKRYGWKTALKNSCNQDCGYTSYKQNVGMFSDANKMNQRQLRSDEACKEWCDQYPGCRAAVISPSHWAYRECFLVSTSTITSRYGWKTALKNGCNQDCGYTSYKQNVGMFSDANKMNQRQLRSDEACKEWCDQYPGCRAAVISPSHWAYRECFLVSTSTITSRYGWKTALKNC